MSKIIFLIGMPGAGKTEWGKRICHTYHLPHIDLDEFIASDQNNTISALFEAFGESAFRKIESQALQQIISDHQSPFVLSTGGGTPVGPDNLSLMKKHGYVIYLQASIPTIIKNIQLETQLRPLLADAPDHEARLRTLYGKRRNIYEQAHHIFDVETLTISNFEPIVKECIKRHSS